MIELVAMVWDWLKANPTVCLLAIVAIAIAAAALDRTLREDPTHE
jgi:hypothetical protein